MLMKRGREGGWKLRTKQCLRKRYQPEIGHICSLNISINAGVAHGLTQYACKQTRRCEK